MTVGTFQQINNRHFSSPIRDFGWFFTGYKLRREILTLRNSGKLPTYPSANPTFSPKWEVSVNAGITEGWVGSFSKLYTEAAFLSG